VRLLDPHDYGLFHNDADDARRAGVPLGYNFASLIDAGPDRTGTRAGQVFRLLLLLGGSSRRCSSRQRRWSKPIMEAGKTAMLRWQCLLYLN
jgi:hypothetical protein